jgi:hypothetical protein
VDQDRTQIFYDVYCPPRGLGTWLEGKQPSAKKRASGWRKRKARTRRLGGSTTNQDP